MFIERLAEKLRDLLHKKREERRAEEKLPPEPCPIHELSQEEVEMLLDRAADMQPELADWRTSWVDLQKLCGLPSDREYRTRVAREELDMPDYSGTAADNIEAHKRVMAEIAKRNIAIPQP